MSYFPHDGIILYQYLVYVKGFVVVGFFIPRLKSQSLLRLPDVIYFSITLW